VGGLGRELWLKSNYSDDESNLWLRDECIPASHSMTVGGFSSSVSCFTLIGGCSFYIISEMRISSRPVWLGAKVKRVFVPLTIY